MLKFIVAKGCAEFLLLVNMFLPWECFASFGPNILTNVYLAVWVGCFGICSGSVEGMIPFIEGRGQIEFSSISYRYNAA